MTPEEKRAIYEQKMRELEEFERECDEFSRQQEFLRNQQAQAEKEQLLRYVATLSEEELHKQFRVITGPNGEKAYIKRLDRTSEQYKKEDEEAYKFLHMCQDYDNNCVSDEDEDEIDGDGLHSIPKKCEYCGETTRNWDINNQYKYACIDCSNGKMNEWEY